MTKPSNPPSDLLMNDDVALLGSNPPAAEESSVENLHPLSLELPLLTAETKNIHRRIDRGMLLRIREALDPIYNTYAQYSDVPDQIRQAMVVDPIAINMARGIFVNQIEDEFDFDLILKRLFGFMAIITSVKVTDACLNYNPYCVLEAVGPTLKSVFDMTPKTPISGDIQAAVLFNVVHNAAFTTRPKEPILSVVELCAQMQLDAATTTMLLNNMLKAIQSKEMNMH